MRKKKKVLTYTQMTAKAIGKKFGPKAAQEHLDAMTQARLLRKAEEEFNSLNAEKSSQN